MKTDKRFGSAAGLVISLVIGFVFYFGMQAIGAAMRRGPMEVS